MSKSYNFFFLSISIIVLFFNHSAFGQSKMLMLKSESGKLKEFKLADDRYLSISIPSYNTEKTCCYTSYYGTAVKIDSGEITMKVRKEVYFSKDKGAETKSTTKYKNFNQREISLDLDSINSIRLQSKTSENIFNASGVLALLGVITTVVVAPLSGIKNGGEGYDAKRFLKVAGIGLGAVAVAIPVAYFSKPKAYVLKDFSGNEKEIWTVVK